MRILLTTDTYFPMVNGVVISTYNLYKELKNKGHEVKIITLSHTDEEWVDGDIYYLKSIKINVYPDARIKVPFHNKLIKEVIKWQPDIIHSQTEFSTMIAAKHIARNLDIPQIHTYHTMYEDYLKYIFKGKVIRKGAAAKIIKLILNSVDAVVAPTGKTKNALINYGVNSDMYVIPTGIDLSKYQKPVFEEEKEELLLNLGLKREDRIMVYVGRVAEEKNIGEIIDFFPEVLKKTPKAKLLIVGGGPELENLKLKAYSMNLSDKIIFTGMVKPEEVYKYYKLGHLFVTASTSETQGLTYLEALSTGCPVVCRYDKCIEKVIVQGKNGFAYTNASEFSKYASRILSDEALRSKMSKEAESKAEEYSSRTFAGKMLEAYEKTILLQASMEREVRVS